MPPKVKVTKEDIIAASIEMVRQEGAEVLNARAIAARMGCSTQPIFSNYACMEEVKQDVMKHAHALYLDFLKREIESGKYPVYKASGMGYIDFAIKEKELFKLLFMRDRSKEKSVDELDESAQMSIAFIQENMKISYEEATRFHLSMWIYIHGIASMLVTSYLTIEWDDISKMMTDIYQGLRARYLSKEE